MVRWSSATAKRPARCWPSKSSKTRTPSSSRSHLPPPFSSLPGNDYLQGRPGPSPPSPFTTNTPPPPPRGDGYPNYQKFRMPSSSRFDLFPFPTLTVESWRRCGRHDPASQIHLLGGEGGLGGGLQPVSGVSGHHVPLQFFDLTVNSVGKAGRRIADPTTLIIFSQVGLERLRGG